MNLFGGSNVWQPFFKTFSRSVAQISIVFLPLMNIRGQIEIIFLLKFSCKEDQLWYQTKSKNVRRIKSPREEGQLLGDALKYWLDIIAAIETHLNEEQTVRHLQNYVVLSVNKWNTFSYEMVILAKNHWDQNLKKLTLSWRRSAN